jgi:hypothetical protein
MSVIYLAAQVLVYLLSVLGVCTVKEEKEITHIIKYVPKMLKSKKKEFGKKNFRIYNGIMIFWLTKVNAHLWIHFPLTHNTNLFYL